ncbi:MAG: hypothetical protein QF479_01815 [Candidatus Poseidoniaceae archaeon]|nr:hypothetical protein [Candidatus Poseidoniaceae archaeon]
MILTPFAAATSISTFSDGSSEVVVQFKDGVNTVNTSEGGFSVPSDETITSASLDISTNPIIMSGNTRVGVESGLPIWDPVLNNQATTYDNLSNFTYQDDTGAPTPLSFSSESFITDFESNISGFTNLSTFGLDEEHDVTGDPLTWQYGLKSGRSSNAGPDLCASGDMCWGTTFEDDDYTDDSTDANENINSPFYFEMTSPSVFLDPNLNDTYLRFSSWHSLRKNVMPNGDLTFSDCAYIKVASSPTGNFGSTTFYDHLQFTIPYSTGISPSNGFFLRQDTPPAANLISNDCLGIPSNNYGLAGSSISLTNQDGWAHLAANLAPYLGTHVKIKFVLESTDTEQTIAWGDKSGWFIDDFQIGESYASEGEMTVTNVQAPTDFSDKQPNGFGLLFVDSFEPGDSKILVDVKDAASSQYITVDGAQLRDLNGPVIELWGIDIDAHPQISIVFKFSSDTLGVSTPSLYGYNVGTRVGNTFVDLQNIRDLNLVEEEWVFNNQSNETNILKIDSTDLVDYFSNPIYGVIFSDMDKCNNYNATLNSTNLQNTTNLSDNTYVEFENPIFDFELTLALNESCTIADVWLDLFFGHHPSDSSVDIAGDGVIDWGLLEPAQGDFGRQNRFWAGEVNGISESFEEEKLELDPVAGNVTGGFFILPRFSHVDSLDFLLSDSTMNSLNLSYDYVLELVLSFNLSINCGRVDDSSDIYFSELDYSKECTEALNFALSSSSLPIFKTDQFGVEWMRMAVKVSQPDQNGIGFLTVSDMDAIYTFTHTLNESNGFDSMLREFVASESQSSQSNEVYIPMVTTSSRGGGVKLDNLSIITEPGYDSSLTWLSDKEGLYPSGELYEIKTTHEVQSSTGSTFSSAQLRFSSVAGDVIFVYDPNTGFSELEDSNNLLTLAQTSSTAVPFGNSGGKEITWRFTVNGQWDDTDKVSIFSETVAANGVVGMLGGIIIDPSAGNAVENDAGITDFELYNAADILQNRDLVYSNQFFKISGEVMIEDTTVSPDPSSYYLVVEEKSVELDGEFANVSWNEIANRTGVIGGVIDWTIDLGVFASGNETYRFRMKDYSNGDLLCPDANYEPDQDCSILFNVTMDILDPNLLGIQLYKRYSGEGDPNLDENWRNLYDQSWAAPRVSQDFRIIASDLPTPPATAVMHVWVENDHDANSNGIAEASEYIQIQTTSNGQVPNATYTGSYNDYANSGLKGQVSLWVECYDLAGNPIDGGGPGLDNDIITYISMELDYPSIKNLFIDDSNGERFINNLPVNPPQGVGTWNQTMFAGNEYHLIVEAEDQNGWKDVEYIMVNLAPTETNYDSVIWYFPRNDSAWTDSPFITLQTNPDGTSKAKIRNENGNVLIDPFESDFYLDLPIVLDWGLPFGQFNTPSFAIKDLDNSQIFSESSFRQSWRYNDGIQLDARGDLVNDLMISPIFYDLDAPYSKDIRKGSVYPGDSVSFTGQYVFSDGVLSNVFVNPEVELTLEITRLSVEADFSKGYSKLDGEVTTHTFTGGKFNITLNAPGLINEFDYTFRLINLPVGAQDVTDSKCSGLAFYGCGSFSIAVDGTPPKVVQNSWSAERGEMPDTDSSRFLGSEMPTSTYHCVDVEVIIEEQGSLAEGDVMVKWKYFKDAGNSLTWDPYKVAFGNNELSHVMNLTTTGQGSILAYADCIDLWPDNVVNPEVSSGDIGNDNVKLVMWIDAVDGSGSQVIFGGQPTQESGALGILSSDVKHASSYDFIFEKAQFQVRNVRLNPSSPEIGDSVTLEIEVLNIGSLAGPANLSIRSVTNDGNPILEGTVVSEEIGMDQSIWVSIKLEEFRDATTGMYYIVDDNTCTSDCTSLYNGKIRGDSFNVKVASDSGSGLFTPLIVAILVGVIGILGVVVVVISRREGSTGDYFDEDGFEFEEEKSYAEVPYRTTPVQSANVTPQMADAMGRFPQWTQEDIQGYFDQGWDVDSLQEWIDGQ